MIRIVKIHFVYAKAPIFQEVPENLKETPNMIRIYLINFHS